MKKLSFLLFCCSLLAACNSADKDKENLKKQYNEYWKKNAKPEPVAAKALDASYKEYFLKHKADTSIPTMMFQDAELNINALQNNNEGMRLLDQIEKEYPNHWRVPDALYLQAFTYEQSYHNNDLAKAKYEEIIQKFPNHPYAEQARQSIKMLGKDLNEWVKHLSDSANKTGK
jgi:TolA-binding protein